MIIHKAECRTEVKHSMRGGAGSVEITHLEDSDTLSNGRLFARLTLPPGASIGTHVHEGETEYYYIISGTGEVEEHDGLKQVGPGDVVVTGGGDSHSIINTGNHPLEFIALILFDQ